MDDNAKPQPAKPQPVTVDQYRQRMQQKMDTLLEGVITAVNQAPDGAWINDSETQVRDLCAEFRRDAYETALQMRLGATQAAFSPGGQGIGPTPAQQGDRKPQCADLQRPGGIGA